MTPREQAVAAELGRLAREELRRAGVEPRDGDPLPAPDEPLAARLDSLLLLSLVVAVEDRFQIALTDDDARHARSLADLARLVAARTTDPGLPAAAERDLAGADPAPTPQEPRP